MNELLIIRHAKSSWDDEGLSDFDRPLNERGLRDAPRMGRWLVEQSAVPDLIISSTAVRAQQTTELLAAACNCDSIDWAEQLYLASASTCLLRLNSVGEHVKRVAIVAHNPGLEQLVELISGRPERMPTAAIALIRVTDDWRSVGATSACEFQSLWRPKELPAEFE